MPYIDRLFDKNSLSSPLINNHLNLQSTVKLTYVLYEF